MICGTALDCKRDNFLCLFVGAFTELGFDLDDLHGSVVTNVVFNLRKQFFAGLSTGKSCNLFELCKLLVDGLFDLFCFRFVFFNLTVESFFFMLERFEFLFDRFFLGLQTLFHACQLAAALFDLAIAIVFLTENFFFCFEQSFFFLLLGQFFAFFNYLCGLSLGRADLCLAYLAAILNADEKEYNRKYDCRNDCYDYSLYSSKNVEHLLDHL